MLVIAAILLFTLIWGIYETWKSYSELKETINQDNLLIYARQDTIEKVMIALSLNLHIISHDLQQIKTNQRAAKKRETKIKYPSVFDSTGTKTWGNTPTAYTKIYGKSKAVKK